jgi:predicted aspartyl protease/tetratricopeptide (TPR) repeat protein
LLITATFSLLPVGSFAACAIGKIADLPVRMDGMRALVPVKINGANTNLIVDSGAFLSVLSTAGAAQVKAKVSPTTVISTIAGVNGEAGVEVATLDQFVLDGIPMAPHYQFLVGGTDPGAGAVGLLGENILGIEDSEYDLANGIIRLMKPQDCGDHPLAYWAAASKLPIQMLTLVETGGHASGHIIATAELNGHKIYVLFDTGAPTSVLTLRAARRAGVTPSSPGVVSTGTGGGLGRGGYLTWVGPFESFKLGGEETHHTRLRFGDLTLGDIDMLLGMDFFLSHHVYVSKAQHRLYFTYNGGPVFNLASLAASSAQAGESAAASAQPPTSGSELHTATEFAARGRALLARREFDEAIVNLTQACQLDPNQPEYFLQRARAYFGTGQGAPAKADLDMALKLKADYVEALLTRAQVELLQKDAAAASADLDAADHTVPPQSDQRLELSILYLSAQLPEQSVHQLDLWISAHAADAKLPTALNQRCWSRVLWNRELDKAEADCRRALRLAAGNPNALDSLGWVQLRQSRFDRSVQQFDAALEKQPKLASSLYGRGIDKLRMGDKAGGEADMAAASAIQPEIADQMRAYGIAP